MYSNTLQTEIQIPLWKMDLTAETVERVKSALRISYYKNKLDRYSIEDSLNSLICFSEWWRTVYDGGSASKQSVVQYIGLPKEAEEKLYLAAKKGLALLKIKIIHSPRNYELQFRTMLLQGGIPKNILFGENQSSFIKFLKKLYIEIENKSIDWDDALIIDSLDCKFDLPSSFRKEEIYALGLKIVKAVSHNREDLLPFDSSTEELRKLVEDLKEVRKSLNRQKPQKPFSFKWELMIDDGVGSLYYTLDNIKHVNQDLLNNPNSEPYQFSIEVNGRNVATYRKSGSQYVRMSMSNARTRWGGENFLDVRASSNSFESCSLPVANNYPPDFDKLPQVFNYDGVNYVQRNTDRTSKSIVVFNKCGWFVPQGNEVRSLVILGKEYSYCEFSDILTLKSRNGEESFVCQNKFSDYIVIFKSNSFDWMDSASFTLIDGLPHIEIYSEEEAKPRIERMEYKARGTSEWIGINRHSVLPAGLLQLRMHLPDGTYDREFYNVAGLSFDIQEESDVKTRISVECPWGRSLIHKLNDIEISEIGQNTWILEREGNSPSVPAKIRFSIYDRNTNELVIEIPSPFKVFCLKDNRTATVPPEETIISLHDLNSYSIVQRGNNRHLLIKYDKGTLSDESYQQDNIPAVTCVPIKDYITPLGKYESAICSMLSLFNHNPFNRTEGVIILIGRSKYKIRPFILDSRLREDGTLEIMGRGAENCEEIYACEVGDNIVDGELKVKPLRKLESRNCFSPRYSKSEDANINFPFIVFSGISEKYKLVPKLICDDPSSVRRSSSVNVWIDRLTKDDPSIGLFWREAANAFEIASDYQLPFRTFNQIKAVAARPELMCKFILALFFNDKVERALSEIQRFEQEFSIAVHWIRPDIWKDCTELLLPNRDIRDFFEFLKELIERTGGYTNFIVGMENKCRGEYHFTTDEINRFRSCTNASLEPGALSPTKEIKLCGEYFPGHLEDTMRPEQKTLINSALFVVENLLKKRNDLWNNGEDMEETRRIICFYSREFYYVYNEILIKELQ